MEYLFSLNCTWEQNLRFKAESKLIETKHWLHKQKKQQQKTGMDKLKGHPSLKLRDGSWLKHTKQGLVDAPTKPPSFIWRISLESLQKEAPQRPRSISAIR